MSRDTVSDLLGRLPLPEQTRLLRWALAGATALALLFVLLGDLVAGLSAGIGRLLYAFVRLLPLVGLAVLCLGGYWLVANRDDEVTKVTTRTPETGSTAANAAVGAGLERLLSSAASSRYRCRQHSAGTEIAGALRQGAIRHVRTRDGHDYDTARSLVDAGEWTDDPIAAAFLAEECRYPLVERLRGAVDPGAAYRRRVDRTLTVIERGTDGAAEPDNGVTQ